MHQLVTCFACRCVDDAAAMLNLLAGRDVMDSTTVSQQHSHVTLSDDVTVSGIHIGTQTDLPQNCQPPPPTTVLKIL